MTKVKAKIKNTDPIKKANDGSYYFRANLGYDTNGKKKQKYRSGFKTKKEAREAYSKILVQAKEGILNPKTMNFKTFIEEFFLPWKKLNVKKKTFEDQQGLIRKHFVSFYHLEVREIEPIHIQEWQLKLSKKLKKNSVRKIQSFLTSAFKRAIILGLTETNP